MDNDNAITHSQFAFAGGIACVEGCPYWRMHPLMTAAYSMIVSGMSLQEAIARELEKLGQDELELVLTLVHALASPTSSRRARMVEWLLDHYLQAAMRLRVNEQPRRPNEDVDPMAQRAAEALEKMWDIARAQGITDEDVLAEIQAHRARRLSQQQGYSLC
jgi:thioesterase domain-containing protein